MQLLLCCIYQFSNVANYIQLEYESRSVPLVNGQKVILDHLTPAVFLTCVGTLPHWYNYPTSNTTTLNSNILYIDMFDIELEGEYTCIDNSTRDFTSVTITTSQGSLYLFYICCFNGILLGFNVTANLINTEIAETDYIRIESFDTSQVVQSGDYPILPYGTQGVKLSCSLAGPVTWVYPGNTNGVCLITGGVLIRSVTTETRGVYSCSNGAVTVATSLNSEFVPSLCLLALTFIMFLDVIELNSSQLIAGYGIAYIPVLSRNVTLSCDISSINWLLIINQNNIMVLLDSNNYETIANETLIQVIDGVIYFDSFGFFESGYYTCEPNSPMQSTIYLQSIG